MSFTGAPSNDRDPTGCAESVPADALVGTQRALGGTSPLEGYRSYTRPFWVSVDKECRPQKQHGWVTRTNVGGNEIHEVG